MIARMWHGMVPMEKAMSYLERMRVVALPDYTSARGNRGAYCLYRKSNAVAHFEMLTFWDGIEAIRRFAGADYEMAKYYDFDREFLLELEPRVRHFDVYES